MVRSCTVKVTKQMRNRSYKLRAIFASVLLATTTTAASAAQMEVKRYGSLPVLFFHGKIENGDQQKFSNLAKNLPPKSVVMLRSDGPSGLSLPSPGPALPPAG
jgi:hypothetical protein